MGPDCRQTRLEVDNRNHNEHRSHITNKNTSGTRVVEDSRKDFENHRKNSDLDHKRMNFQLSKRKMNKIHRLTVELVFMIDFMKHDIFKEQQILCDYDNSTKLPQGLDGCSMVQYCSLSRLSCQGFTFVDAANADLCKHSCQGREQEDSTRSILVLLVVTYGTVVLFAAAYDEYVLLSAKCQENCEFDWLLGARGQFKFVPVVTWTLYRFFYFVPMVSD
ncbi:hypothetical protein Tco_0211261 [Tanacetum coccineum]